MVSLNFEQQAGDDGLVSLSSCMPLTGKALLLTAGNGMGKTTIAREIARRMEVNKDTTLSECALTGKFLDETPSLKLEFRDTLCRLQSSQHTWNSQGYERSAGWMARPWYCRFNPSDIRRPSLSGQGRNRGKSICELDVDSKLMRRPLYSKMTTRILVRLQSRLCMFFAS